MGVGLVDLLVVVWVIWWARRGARRGLPTELPRTLGVFLFGVSGFGLVHWTSGLLVHASRLTGQSASGLSFLVLLVGAKLLVNRFRRQIAGFAEQRWGLAPRWAAFTGGSRALMLACISLAFFIEGPLQGLTRPIANSSLLGRVLAWSLLPAERAN